MQCHPQLQQLKQVWKQLTAARMPVKAWCQPQVCRQTAPVPTLAREHYGPVALQVKVTSSERSARYAEVH